MAGDYNDVETSIATSDAGQQVFDVRLDESTSSRSRLVGTWIFGLLLGGVAYGCIVLGQHNPEMYYSCIAAAVVIGLLAALLLWSAIQQTLSILLIPATVVEVERETIGPGDSMRFCVKQPGPIFLKSLRANLVCSQRRERKTYSATRGRHHARDPERLVHHENLIDTDGGWLFPGQTRQWIASLMIPEHSPESGKDNSIVTVWRIEVWGRTHVFLGFMRQFTLGVRRND